MPHGDVAVSGFAVSKMQEERLMRSASRWSEGIHAPSDRRFCLLGTFKNFLKRTICHMMSVAFSGFVVSNEKWNLRMRSASLAVRRIQMCY